VNRFGARHFVQATLAAIGIAAALPSTASAQQARPDVVGRAARVWARGTEAPIAGRVSTSTDDALTLETEAPYCGSGGCARTYSIDWPDVDRMQVGLSSTNRGIRAAIAGVALGLLMGPGLHSCDDAATLSKCERTIIGLSGAVGIAGLFLTRQSWEDVVLPR
jgi:hypothetical protein